MEATGVYWKPVWHLLEDDFELMLVNARHVKQVPGRKTDMSDAASLCQLAAAVPGPRPAAGLVNPHFGPPKAAPRSAAAAPISQDAARRAPTRGAAAA